MAKTVDDILSRAKECFREAKEAFSENRDRMVEDLRFSNPACPEQWDDATRRARENNANGARPCLTFDQTNQYIAQVVNDSRQNKPGIKVIPVDSGADVEVAQKLEGIIRHIEYQSRAGIAYDTAIEYAARVGLGWLRVLPEIVNPALNEQEIRIKRVHDPLSVVLDPNAQEPDGSDADYGFIETLLTKKAFKRQYPDAAMVGWDSDDTVDGWISTESIRVCEYFYKVRTDKNMLTIVGDDGESSTVGEDEYWEMAQAGAKPQITASFTSTETVVKWVKMTGLEVLEETDFPSKYIPLVPVMGYELWQEGKRYLCGMTRRMIDSQRAYNYERTSYIEQVALQPKAPFLIPFESVENFENDWASANTSNRAYLPYNALDDEGRQLPPPQRQAPPPIASAFLQGSQIAMNDIQASIGMYKSNLGAPSNSISGKAKLQDQREGDTANFHYIDNLSRGIEQLGRIVVGMIPLVYDTKRQARMTGDDGKVDQVTIDPELPTAKSKGGKDGKEVTINPGVGTYDVRVKAGPSYSTLRQESAEAIGNILQGNPQAMAVLGPEWARMQDWPNADKIARLLLAMAPPAVQAVEQGDADIPPAAQAQLVQLKQQNEQLQQQLQQAMQAAEGKQAELRSQAENDHNSTMVNAYNAETNRLKVLGPAMDPQQIQVLVMQALRDIMSAAPPGMPPGPPPGAPPMPPPGQPPISPQPPSGGFSLPAANAAPTSPGPGAVPLS